MEVDRRSPLQIYVPVVITVALAAGSSYVANAVKIAQLQTKQAETDRKLEKVTELLSEHQRDLTRLRTLSECRP